MGLPEEYEHSAFGSGGEDISMIRALGKAFYWQKLLDQGEFATIRDLSRSMKWERGWVAEVLRMTMLAPGHHQGRPRGQTTSAPQFADAPRPARTVAT
jgi:hypothetical protein